MERRNLNRTEIWKGVEDYKLDILNKFKKDGIWQPVLFTTVCRRWLSSYCVHDSRAGVEDHSQLRRWLVPTPRIIRDVFCDLLQSHVAVESPAEQISKSEGMNPMKSPMGNDGRRLSNRKIGPERNNNWSSTIPRAPDQNHCVCSLPMELVLRLAESNWPTRFPLGRPATWKTKGEDLSLHTYAPCYSSNLGGLKLRIDKTKNLTLEIRSHLLESFDITAAPKP